MRLVPRCGSAGEQPILGPSDFAGQYGKGWGKPKPRTIYNGVAPSGLVRKIRWRKWGTSVARGRGRTYIYRPEGGYYPGSVPAELRVSNVGFCNGGFRLMYRRLLYKVPTRPGGNFGRWYSWSGARSLCNSPVA